MALIFFPVKAENEYFSNLKKGDFFGAFLSIYFGLNSIHKKLFSKAYFIFQNQIEPRKSSKKSSFFRFVKYTFSAFTGKKINVVAILDHFLAPKECNSNTQGSQRVAKKWLPLLHYLQSKIDLFTFNFVNHLSPSYKI